MIENEKIPFNLYSKKKIKDMTGMAKTKEKTTEVTFEEKVLDIPVQTNIPNEESQFLVREAILEAVMTPYLKGVILGVCHKEGTSLTFIHASPSPMTNNEIKGAMVAIYEEVTGTGKRKVNIPFQEGLETHMIEGHVFSRNAMERMKGYEQTEVFVLNVHHNRVKGFTNLQDVSRLLHVLQQLEKEG